MIALIAPIIEFLDVAFLRLLWALFVQYLVATGFLMPEQQQQWTEGWSHIILVAGTVVSIVIWQTKSHRKETVRVITKSHDHTVEETVENPSKTDDVTNVDILSKYKSI